jgi:hypothetical protein
MGKLEIGKKGIAGFSMGKTVYHLSVVNLAMMEHKSVKHAIMINLVVQIS